MTKMEYKISLKNHLNTLSGTIIFTIFCFIVVYLIGINEGFNIDLFYFFGAFYFLNIVVVFYLHFQYYKANKQDSFIIDKVNRQIIYKANSLERTINFNDLQKIEVHMMPSVYRNSNIQIAPFEHYYYAVIYSSNDRFIITCLLMKESYKVFNDLNLDLKINRIKRIFPNIK